MRGNRVLMCAAATMAAALLLGGGGAFAAYGPPPTPSTAWVVSGGGLGTGTVKSIAVSGSTAYIGGNFSYVGPATGGSAAFNASSGALVSPWPQVAGIVYAVVTDGSGGWYLGGDFDSIGTGHYDNIAHVKADGTVDTAWKGGTNGTVFSIVVSGSRVFAGGAFSTAHDASATVTRNALAAFDTTNGTVQSFNVSVTDADGKAFVWAMALSSNNLYFGGHFDTVGSQSRNNLAGVTALTGSGTVFGFNPNVNGTVRAVAVQGDGTIYAGGDFTTVNVGFPQSATRLGLAAFNSTGFADGSWNPNPGNPQSGTTPRIDSLATFGSGALAVIYAGGNFNTMGGQTRRSLAKISDNGTVDGSWNPDIPGPASVNRIVVSTDGQTVYAAGFFQTVGATSRDSLVALSSSGAGAPTSFHPIVGGATYGLGLSNDGSKLAVGGWFSAAGPQLVRRNNLAAIDIATGQPTSWAPYTDDTVNAVAVLNSNVYVGGVFKQVTDTDHLTTPPLSDRIGIAAFHTDSGDANSGDLLRGMLSWRADR